MYHKIMIYFDCRAQLWSTMQLEVTLMIVVLHKLIGSKSQ